ncbi:MAG: CPBP family intramembrane glutamic endopeptidase [Pirellulaceae bacterium]
MIHAAWRFVAEPLQRAADEHRQYLREREGKGFDWRPAVVLVTTALLLTMRFYMPGLHSVVEMLRRFDALLPSALLSPWLDDMTSAGNAALSRHVFWALWQTLAFGPVPLLLIKLVLRDRAANYGTKLRGMTSCWYVYLGMYLVMLPAVLVVSTTAAFQTTYPFLKPPRAVVEPSQFPQPTEAGGQSAPSMAEDGPMARLLPRIPSSYWPQFWTWQCFYAIQFVSLEFFFRGFLVHSLRRPMGAYAILVMTVPYCMIHFGKPIPETLGAIVAGIVLGFMSLKTRSIWMGAALHIAVAMTMDFAALAQR